MTRVMYLIHLASRIITANASNFNMFIRRYAVHTPVRVCLGFLGPIQTRMGVPAAGRSRKCESVSGSHLCRALWQVCTINGTGCKAKGEAAHFQPPSDCQRTDCVALRVGHADGFSFDTAPPAQAGKYAGRRVGTASASDAVCFASFGGAANFRKVCVR